MASAGPAAGRGASTATAPRGSGWRSAAADAPSPARWQLAQSASPFEAEMIHLGRRTRRGVAPAHLRLPHRWQRPAARFSTA